MKKFSAIAITAMIIGILLPVFFNLGLDNAAFSASAETEWQLTVTGLVANSLNLTLSDLRAMPQTAVSAQLFCVGPPGFLVDEGNWTGVKLGLLLETAGVSSSAIKVAFFASDGFSTDLTIESAINDNIIVAYEKDGDPLAEVIRLAVPGRWGYKWIHHLNRIELVDYDYLGKYESLGYSDTAFTTQPGSPDGAGSRLPETITRNNSTSTSSPQSPSPSPTPSPSTTPTTPTSPDGGLAGSPEPVDLTEEITVIGAVAAVIVVSVSLIVYRVKFKKRTPKEVI